VAISDDGRTWFLVNASPDLPAQIETFKPLQPVSPNTRHTPIAGVFLTNADLDHVAGLLLMRQNDQPQRVWCSDEMRAQLRWIDPALILFGGITYHQVPLDFLRLTATIDFRAVSIAGDCLAYDFLDRTTGKRCLIAPAVGQINADLQTALNWCHTMLFDGTFWSNEELKCIRPTARTALEMGHVPVEQSIDLLSRCRAEFKIYTHINNTNPILNPHSPERAQVNSIGITVGEDGMELQL
jgi:pyrroloquinoline quinone biosynthesis protein B